MYRKVTVVLSVILLVLAASVPAMAQGSGCTLDVEVYREEGLADFDGGELDGAIENFACVIELDPEDPVAYNNIGFFYGLAGESELGLENLGTAIELAPNYARAYSNRGSLLYSLGRYEEAISDYETAFEIDASGFNPVLYNDWGLTLYYMGDSAAAIEKYNAALELAPEYPQALNNRGFAYLEINEEDLAIADFETVLQLSPETSASYIGLGDAYYLLGQAQPSLDAYSTYAGMVEQPIERVAARITELEGIIAGSTTETVDVADLDCDADEDVEGFTNLGLASLEIDNLQMALDNFSCAIQASPEEAMPHNNRGYVYLEMGNLEAAGADLSQAIALNPELAIAYHNLGRVYAEAGNFENALNNYSQSIRLDNSGSNESFLLMGYLYMNVDEYETALPYLNRSANSFTGNADALANMAYSFIELERYDEAFLALEQLAIRMDRENFPAGIEEMTQNVEALTGGTVMSSKVACEMAVVGGTSSIARDYKEDGNAAFQAGDFDEALEQYNCALEFSPFDSYTYNNIASVYFRMGEIEMALEAFAKSLELNPFEAETYANLGYLYTDTGDNELAEEFFGTALEWDDEHVSSYYGRAALFAGQERWEEAKADLDTVVALFGSESVPPVVTDLLADVESNLE